MERLMWRSPTGRLFHRRSSDSEGAIAEMSASALNDTRIDVWWSKLMSTGGSDELTVIDQLGTVGLNHVGFGKLTWPAWALNSIRWRTGSQWSCRRIGDVVASASAGNQTCRGVLGCLQPSHQTVSDSDQEVVQTQFVPHTCIFIS